MEKTKLTQEQLITKQLEVLQETVDYYSKDVSRRAVDEEGGCRYLTSDGRMCAVGRCLTSESIQDVLDYEQEQKTSIAAIEAFKYGGGKLKSEYSDLQECFNFWMALQCIHDHEDYWNKRGLSKWGIEHVEDVKQNIKKGYYV